MRPSCHWSVFPDDGDSACDTDNRRPARSSLPPSVIRVPSLQAFVPAPPMRHVILRSSLTIDTSRIGSAFQAVRKRSESQSLRSRGGVVPTASHFQSGPPASCLRRYFAGIHALVPSAAHQTVMQT